MIYSPVFNLKTQDLHIIEALYWRTQITHLMKTANTQKINITANLVPAKPDLSACFLQLLSLYSDLFPVSVTYRSHWTDAVPASEGHLSQLNFFQMILASEAEIISVNSQF